MALSHASPSMAETQMVMFATLLLAVYLKAGSAVGGHNAG